MKRLFAIVLFCVLGISGKSFALPPCPTSGVWDNCFGTYTFSDGGKYVGEWKEDGMHGQGTYISADGGKYVGGWKDNQRHGQGTFTYADGEKYVGQWKDSQKHGQGTYTYADGTKYRGKFADGEMHGLGEFTDIDGRRYIGEYKYGQQLDFHEVSKVVESAEKYMTAKAHYDAGRFAEALKLYHELAEAGWAPAYIELGWMYVDGVGVPQDGAEALKWWQKLLMHPTDPYPEKGATAWNISTIYVTGQGVPKDEAMAYAYRSISKALGFERAIKAFKAREDFRRDFGKSSEPEYVVAQGQVLARQIWAKMEAAKSRKSEDKPEATAKKSGSTGSGFYINFQGHLITNSHVVNDCNQINTLQDGERTNTTVVINDSRNDLALLKTDKQPKTIAYFRSGRGIRAGEDILAFGHPFQSVLSDELKGTKGMVNALSGFNNDSRVMQISAPVQPGNSGGPLLDQAGNVVGVVTAKMDAVKMAKYTGDIPQNVNFALKASLVRDMLEVKDIDYETASSKKEMKTVDIFERAKRFTVLIECLQ